MQVQAFQPNVGGELRNGGKTRPAGVGVQVQLMVIKRF
jgi:hypothetical protein